MKPKRKRLEKIIHEKIDIKSRKPKKKITKTMKTLITTIILLAGINCFGQYTGNDSTYCRPTSEEIIELRMLNDLLPLYLAWNKYETECYNDSIEVDYVTKDTINYQYNLIYKQTLYNHKQPEFTDFMKWLTSKYK